MNCTFSGNCAEDGGAICNFYDDARPTIINCTFSGNCGAEGGGIWSYCGQPTIINCIFSGNSASQFYGYDAEGGAISSHDSDLTIVVNCIFSGNSSEDDGGAIYNLQSEFIIANCIFSGNTAKDGGGIDSGDDIITNCTFWGNAAGDRGGAIYGSSYTIIANCILWGDEAQNGPEIYGSPTVSYCDIDQDGYAGSNGNIRQDPLLIDPANGDFHLQPGSPCIDAGDNTAVPSDITDLDGDGNTTEPIPFDFEVDSRIINGTVDMGADEYSGYEFVTKWGSYGTGDGQFNYSDGVAVDSSGYVYVVDVHNARIQKFTSDGTFVTKWGIEGSGDGQLDKPGGVAVDSSGYVYVADTFNHRVQKFKKGG